jgi:hypothetical protein
VELAVDQHLAVGGAPDAAQGQVGAGADRDRRRRGRGRAARRDHQRERDDGDQRASHGVVITRPNR